MDAAYVPNGSSCSGLGYGFALTRNGQIWGVWLSLGVRATETYAVPDWAIRRHVGGLASFEAAWAVGQRWAEMLRAWRTDWRP